MVEAHVNPVHQRYMDLSGRYKAGWTFHRFVLGLRKFFGSQELEDHTADFQELYTGLREASQALNDPDVQSVIDRLEGLRSRLELLLGSLDEEERRIDPSLVRLFFQRIKKYDDRILVDLIRFYQEVQRGRSWDPDRVDKADFLVTRLAEAVAGGDLSGDRSRLKKVLEGVSAHQADSPGFDRKKIANRQKMIQAVRTKIPQLESFDELTERDLVGHYRHVKHGLGGLLFDQTILPAIVETNLELADRVNALTEEEEKRIFEDYERVSRLEQEGGVGRDLARTVNHLHSQVSRFRKQVGSGNLRLHDMAEIKRLVVEILEQVEGAGAGTAAASEVDGGSGRFAVENAIPSAAERRVIGSAFEELVSVLRKSEVAELEERRLDARALSYRLEERELLAFDRLASQAECDADLERFVLAAAALRHRINGAVKEIHAFRSRVEARESSSAPVTKALLSLGDWYLLRFAHFLETDAVIGDAGKARELQILRMRLMRDYSGLWLVAHT